MTNHPQKGRGEGRVTHFRFWVLGPIHISECDHVLCSNVICTAVQAFSYRRWTMQSAVCWNLVNCCTTALSIC